MDSTGHSTQPIIVLAVDGIPFECAVEWVHQPLRSGAAQCLAEQWVCRAGDVAFIGPEPSEISSPVDLEETVNMWWRQRK